MNVTYIPDTAGDSCIGVIGNPQVATGQIPDFLRMSSVVQAHTFHRSLPMYNVTPLVSMDTLAQQLGIKSILVKDESKRFGLNSFKALGGSYAVFRLACEKYGLDPDVSTYAELQSSHARSHLDGTVFITATDGNHGKGVAWSAGLLGFKTVVLMPKGSSAIRAQAIRDVGNAEVTITDLDYDDTVRLASKMARENGWMLVQDTSWDGYEEIPTWIIQGYTTLAMEAVEQAKAIGARPTHVFLQAGVGSMAGGILGFLTDYYCDHRPIFSIVEPSSIACIFSSVQAADGRPHPVVNRGMTIMAGLNCGEPCTITWPILRDFSSHYFSCPDYIAAEGMREYKRSAGIISGESGAVTLGLLLHLLRVKAFSEIKAQTSLHPDSVVLLINTEGDTDPESYAQIINKRKYPSPFF